MAFKIKELSKEDQALFDAIEKKDLEAVKTALKTANMNVKDTWNGAPINLAARLGATAIVKLLCEKGADIESKDPTDQTPLMAAALEGHVETADFLLGKGAKVTHDLAMSMSTKVRALEENAQRGMIKPEAVVAWKAFLKKLQEHSKK